MKTFHTLVLALVVLVGGLTASSAEAGKSLKVLVIAGGCCHDYATQSKLLKQGIEARINAEVTVAFNPSRGTDATFKIYESDDWAKPFDVILHDECSASVTDKKYINRILNAHKSGTPAVNLHCAMHSYRWGDFRKLVKPGADNHAWFEMIGLQSTGHGPQSPIDIKYVDANHPITIGFDNWTTINEELYNNIEVYEGTKVIATGTQVQKPRKRDLKKNPNAKPKTSTAAIIWLNEYGPKKTRVFSTSLGHNNDTVADARYLDLVVRGLLWTTGNLSPDGRATNGYAK